MSSISPQYVLKQSGEAITDLEFWSPHQTSTLIASYGGKGGVDVWNLSTRRSCLNLPSEVPMLSAHGFATGELLTYDKEGNLKLLDLSESSAITKNHLIISEVGFCKAAVLPEDEHAKKIIAVPGEAKSSVNIWNLSEEAICKQLIPSTDLKLGMPWCIKLLCNVRPLAVVGYEDGSLLIWDINEEKLISKASFFSDPLMCFDAFINENANPVLCGIAGSVNEMFVKWNFVVPNETTQNKKDVQESNLCDISIVKQHKLINSGLSCMKIRNDKKILATGGWDYKIRIFSWKNLKPLAVLDYHKGQIQAISFLNDQLLACGSEDNKISIWKIYNN